jgi:hypothetical protein
MNNLCKNSINVTESVRTDEEAIKKKMDLLNTKIFGLFSPVSYELKSKKKIYVPYELLVFSYEIHRGKRKDLKRGMFDREGQVGIIFDLNEVHPFHYDLYEDLEFKKYSLEKLDGDLLKDQCPTEDAEKQCREFVQWRVLQRVFRDLGQVDLVKRVKFYRPAWELLVEARNQEMIRYAYMDGYGSENEHVSGLKVRLDI